MTEGENAHIYLQDELGSAVRLVGMGKTQQTVYGYDEFGRDLYGTQGEMQPFGYTGYQRDDIANTYYAQAREYLPKVGRFKGKDFDLFLRPLKPITLNQYLYCNASPLRYIDPRGLKSYVFYDTNNFSEQADSEAERLESLYKDDIVKIPVLSREKFKAEWDDIDSDDIDEISLLFHGQPYALLINEDVNSALTTNASGKTSKGTTATPIQSLKKSVIFLY